MLLLVLLGLSFFLQSSSSQWVSRNGGTLYYNGQPFRFSGTNIYWLGLDENVGGVNYPTNFRIEDALQTVVELGGTVVRGHTIGVSTGGPKSFLPKLGAYNPSALLSADYAVYIAAKLGLKLVVPLTDNWRYYHGGKHDFTDWRGISDENQFYYNSQVISDFKDYISHLLNHVNPYTNLTRKDDPTIMAWETGNEIQPPASWTKEIADYIKSIDSHHLVLDGTYGVNKDALYFSSVDLYSRHYYPINIQQVIDDARTCSQASKVYYIGEYAWPDSSLSQFLQTIENNGVGGDTFWSLFPHLDTYGWEQHGDGFTIHYPPGDNGQMRSSAETLRYHAFKMTGIPIQPHITPGTPLITNLRQGSIAWRGAVAAANYTVDFSSSPVGPWTTLCNQCATDNNTPFYSNQISSPRWFRVVGFNLAGVPGPYSQPKQLT